MSTYLHFLVCFEPIPKTEKETTNKEMLKATKFLKCHFFHRRDTLHVWLAPGFQSCKEPISMIPDKVSWMMNDLNLGAMNTGFHQ